MIETPTTEVRLPELHKPDLHLPDAVAGFEWPKVDLSSVDVRKAVGDAGEAVGEAGRNAGKAMGEAGRNANKAVREAGRNAGKAFGDAGKAVSDAAAGVHIGRSRTPRWPFAVVGLFAVAAAGWVVLTNTGLRTRLASGARAVGRQAAELRSNVSRSLAARREDAVAFPASPTAPAESTAYGDGTGDATDYPEGLGSNNGHGTLADEEITARV
jgi:hypothetical protein